MPSLPRITASAQREAAPYEPICAIFRRYLHTEKLKFTPERAMILDAVLRKEGLFEPEQLAADLKQLGHRVSRATVYRVFRGGKDAVMAAAAAQEIERLLAELGDEVGATDDLADAIVVALREAAGSHWLRPRFGVAPYRGEFLIVAESDHQDAAAELVPALLACLVHELVRQDP